MVETPAKNRVHKQVLITKIFIGVRRCGITQVIYMINEQINVEIITESAQIPTTTYAPIIISELITVRFRIIWMEICSNVNEKQFQKKKIEEKSHFRFFLTENTSKFWHMSLQVSDFQLQTIDSQCIRHCSMAITVIKSCEINNRQYKDHISNNYLPKYVNTIFNFYSFHLFLSLVHLQAVYLHLELSFSSC